LPKSASIYEAKGIMGKKILIVDDEGTSRTLCEQILTREGYQITTTSGAVEALTHICEKPVDLIITDIVMPNYDGITFYKAIRQEDNGRDVPVIVMSERRKMRDSLMAMGVRAFMEKPLRAESLLAAVADALENPQQRKLVLAKDQIKVAEKTGQTKVFLAGKTHLILFRIKHSLKRNKCFGYICPKGVDILKEIDEVAPDVIILDVLMDEEPTKNLIKKLRKNVKYKDTPIIVFTYLDKSEVNNTLKIQELENARTVCLNAGATDAIKDFEFSSYRFTIQPYLKKGISSAR
jgi:CheY-like chemotaxis protein